jgi:predicted dehydrogenase
MKLRIAQYGTKHGHAAGKLAALRSDPRVEFAGLYEPDRAQRAALEGAGWPYDEVRWYDDAIDLLGDPSIVAVAAEGRNDESLQHAEQIIAAGKHLWLDKPAGDDWQHWRRIAAEAEHRGRIVQLGYMFRYHAGFRRIAELARSGALGRIFAVRAHMSTTIDVAARTVIARHHGGIWYDLAGHMLDQIVWLLGRPDSTTAFFRRDDDASPPAFTDNALVVLSYPHALATVDIAAMEAPPPARRFEVYGTNGSVIMEPFEPCGAIRLCLTAPHGSFLAGEQFISAPQQPRDTLYQLELQAFVATIAGEQAPDRPLAHELLVQETLLRSVGKIYDSQDS